jgi:hypothetical protein
MFKLTQRNRALLDEPNVAKLNIKFFLFYGNHGKGVPLCLINEGPHYEDIWRSGDIATPFLPALDRVEWSASRPGCFSPGERARLYALYRRLGEPQNRSESCGEERNLGSSEDHLTCSPSLYRLNCRGFHGSCRLKNAVLRLVQLSELLGFGSVRKS